MDVLYILKSDHDAIRTRFQNLEVAEGVKNRRGLVEELARALQMHLHLEKDYLYPEVVGLFTGSEALVDAGLASAVIISRRLKVLVKTVAKPAGEQGDFEKRLAELKDIVFRHLDEEERGLMPKVRYMIRTEDREDLGQVFLDVKDETAHGPDGFQAHVATSRKRA